jgi:hypothetical protein
MMTHVQRTTAGMQKTFRHTTVSSETVVCRSILLDRCYSGTSSCLLIVILPIGSNEGQKADILQVLHYSSNHCLSLCLSLTPSEPLILCTSSSSLALILKVLHYGLMDDIVHMPFEFTNLELELTILLLLE